MYIDLTTNHHHHQTLETHPNPNPQSPYPIFKSSLPPITSHHSNITSTSINVSPVKAFLPHQPPRTHYVTLHLRNHSAGDGGYVGRVGGHEPKTAQRYIYIYYTCIYTVHIHKGTV